MPWLLNPAATNNAPTSFVSPMQKLASGVKLSGALRNSPHSVVRNAGIRSSASARTGAK